ncbi:MAG: sulfotransferase domain-containing protein, partial [Geminicoccaceae bacterium]
DGQAATVSYFHYLNNFGTRAFALRDVVLGSVAFGSWSQHVEAWKPTDRPNTLFLLYEDMCRDPKTAIDQIARFLDLPIKGGFSTSFEDLQTRFPKFFRAGKRDVDPSEIDQVDRNLFEVVHGPTMEQFGYGKPNGLDRDALRTALVEAGGNRGRLQALETKTSDLEETLRRKYKEVSELKARITVFEDKISNLNRTLNSKQHEVAGLVPKLSSLESKIMGFEALENRARDLKRAILGGPLAILKMRRHLKDANGQGQSVPLSESPSASIDKLYADPIKKEPIGIALFGFDRDELVQNSLDSLARQNRVHDVHLWVDGDQGNPAKRKRTTAVARLGKKFNVKRIHQHRGNLGFRKMMLQAMTYMSLHYDKIIFLEDDCFPNRDCIATFSDELDAIRDRADVFSVYGHHFDLPNESEYFSRFQGWGWATTSEKLRPLLDDLIQCFFMTEERFLAFTREAMTPEILRLIDVTPGRQPSATLKEFFAWDEALCLLTALRGLKHKRTRERTVYNCGAGERSTHFADLASFRKPPYNMIAASEVWDHF